MELKHKEDKAPYMGDLALLIAPLMELKHEMAYIDQFKEEAFNRTAYGIETSLDCCGVVIIISPFNRTAYGIETFD